MMRFKIDLEVLTPNALISLNYPYQLSGFIYQALEKADPAYARSLHEDGYGFGKRKFKFFTFSPLLIKRREVFGDRLLIKSRYISFMISFYIDKAAERFIMGLFQDQLMCLGDRKTQAKFKIQELTCLTRELKGDSLHLRTLSPMVVARWQEQEQAPVQYLSPVDDDFERYFWDNLIHKYGAVCEAGLAKKIALPDRRELSFRVLNPETVRSRLLHIKPGSKAATQVRGYHHFEFELKAPMELLEVGFYGGFGRYSATIGGGFCDLPVEG